MARQTVIGVYHSHEDAQCAIRELKEAGFTKEQIGIASQDADGTFQEQTEGEGNMAAEMATTGAAAGLGAGALWGLGIAAGMLPAIGPVIAGGTLAAIAASAAVTGGIGGLAGALIGLGIPKEEATYYEGEFKQGRTIVSVNAGDNYDKAYRILDGSNCYDYERRDSDFASDARKQRVNCDGELVACRKV